MRGGSPSRPSETHPSALVPKSAARRELSRRQVSGTTKAPRTATMKSKAAGLLPEASGSLRPDGSLTKHRSGRIAALHNKCFPTGQETGIVLAVDAHGGLSPPSAAASAVPLWRFKSPHFNGPRFRRSIFFAIPRPVTCARLPAAQSRPSRRIRCRSW